VGHLDQLAEDRLSFVFTQVHAQALLAAVVLDPVRALLAHPWRVITSFFAPQALDLDDFGPQTGEHLGAAGSCLMTTEIDHADTVQGTFAIGHRLPSASWISASWMRRSISMPSRVRRARS